MDLPGDWIVAKVSSITVDLQVTGISTLPEDSTGTMETTPTSTTTEQETTGEAGPGFMLLEVMVLIAAGMMIRRKTR